MEQLILNIKDRSKLSFLKQFLKQFDFVEIEKIVKKKNLLIMIFSIPPGYGRTGKLMPMNLENKHGKGKNDTLRYRCNY